jgi:nucleoside-diphosphate-sugar epimerase
MAILVTGGAGYVGSVAVDYPPSAGRDCPCEVPHGADVLLSQKGHNSIRVPAVKIADDRSRVIHGESSPMTIS